MGCPCRQVRQVISHLPGVKHFLRLLPDLPNEGRSDMKMKTQPGRAIFVTSGNGYHADEKGIIHNVLGDDANDLRHAGAEIYNDPAVAAPAPAPVPAPVAAAPKPAAPPAPPVAPVKNDGPPAA